MFNIGFSYQCLEQHFQIGIDVRLIFPHCLMHCQFIIGSWMSDIFHYFGFGFVFFFIRIADFIDCRLECRAIPCTEHQRTLSKHIRWTQFNKWDYLTPWFIRTIPDIFEYRCNDLQFITDRLQFRGIQRFVGRICIAVVECFDCMRFWFFDGFAQCDAATISCVPFTMILDDGLCNGFQSLTNSNVITFHGFYVRRTVTNWWNESESNNKTLETIFKFRINFNFKWISIENKNTWRNFVYKGNTHIELVKMHLYSMRSYLVYSTFFYFIKKYRKKSIKSFVLLRIIRKKTKLRVLSQAHCLQNYGLCHELSHVAVSAFNHQSTCYWKLLKLHYDPTDGVRCY